MRSGEQAESAEGSRPYQTPTVAVPHSGLVSGHLPMATFQVSGPPEDVARLQVISPTTSTLVKHVAAKMRTQKLAPADHLIVLVSLSTADNALGHSFMKQTVDPSFAGMTSGEAYACSVAREELKNFLQPSAPGKLDVAAYDVPAGSQRMVIIAGNGITKMDAAFKN